MKKLILFLLIASGTFITLNGSAQKKATTSKKTTTQKKVTPKSPAQNYKSALGLRISSGSPMIDMTATYKQFISDSRAVEGYFNFGDPTALGGMYQFYKPLHLAGLNWYYGLGGYIGFPKTCKNVTGIQPKIKLALGSMAGLGLDYKFKKIPINLSFDWKPELGFTPKIGFVPLTLGASIRYVFKGNVLKSSW